MDDVRTGLTDQRLGIREVTELQRESESITMFQELTLTDTKGRL